MTIHDRLRTVASLAKKNRSHSAPAAIHGYLVSFFSEFEQRRETTAGHASASHVAHQLQTRCVKTAVKLRELSAESRSMK